MKRPIALFITLTLFVGCGDDEDCANLPAGFYAITTTLTKDTCKLGAPEKMKMVEELPEGHTWLICGEHNESDSEFDSYLQCNIENAFSLITSSANISGSLTLTFRCVKGGYGYTLVNNQTYCVDEFNFYAEPWQGK